MHLWLLLWAGALLVFGLVLTWSLVTGKTAAPPQSSPLLEGFGPSLFGPALVVHGLAVTGASSGGGGEVLGAAAPGRGKAGIGIRQNTCDRRQRLPWHRLQHAELETATLGGVRLSQVALSQAHLSRTVFARCQDLSQSLGLDSLRYTSPSSIDLESLRCDLSDLPDDFLEGGGSDASAVSPPPAGPQ